MKKHGKFYRNPAPFALGIVNPARKRKAVKARKGRKKNPAQLDLFDGAGGGGSAGPAKKPAAKTPVRAPGAIGRSAKSWHHKRGGPFVYNPAAKVRTRRKKTVTASASSSPEISSAIKKPSMKTKRSRKRTRNPARKISRGRSRSRNPHRRRSRMVRRRNPVAIVQDIFNADNAAVGAGILLGVVGAKYTLNSLLQGDATGKRMFDLPGITYPTATAPMTAAQFNDKNKIALAIYEVALPAAVGYFLRTQSPRVAKGLMYSAVVNGGVAILKGTTIGQKAGLGAFLPRGNGVQTYIPGVAPIASGQGTAFLNSSMNGAPRRQGAAAVVTQRWAANAVAQGKDPFAST